MKTDDLIAELGKYLDPRLAHDLVDEFINIRSECKTGMLGRVSAGKFVETCVQVLQYLESGKYEKKPDVDQYLRTLESRATSLNDDLKITFARIARSTYTLRNKRNIAHKGEVDPNIYDLHYVLASAQWMLSEIVRQTLTGNMTTAGRMIEFIQVTVSSVIEDFGDRKLVFGKLTVDEEIIVLLYSYYPNDADVKSIEASLDRRSSSAVYMSLKKLWRKKLIHRENSSYKLTQEGFRKALEILQTLGVK
jgi:hypothetical protein